MPIRFRTKKSTASISSIIFLLISILTSSIIIKGLSAQTSLTADDFFVRLIENKADLTSGYAVYEIRNPLDFDIVANKDILKTRIVNQPDATEITNLKIFVLKNIDYSENITDYSYQCNSYNVEDVNGTYTVNNCTTIASGWHWNNYTKEEWHELNSETFKAKNTYKIKIEVSWLPKVGLNSREWFPKITVNDINYEQTKWAWWNTSWYKKRLITITNPYTNYQIPINVTYDEDMQTDFDDLRFLNAAETTEYPYWIESKVNSAWTYVWVKMVDAGNFYMYYENPNATTTSSGNQTFILFDDFSGATSESPHTWLAAVVCASGYPKEENGYLKLKAGTGGSDDCGAYLNGGGFPNQNVSFVVKINTSAANNRYSQWGITNDADMINPQADSSTKAAVYDGGGQFDLKLGSATAEGNIGTNYLSGVTQTVNWKSYVTNQHNLTLNITYSAINYTNSYGTVTTPKYYFMVHAPNYEFWVSQTRLSKFMSPEPTYSIGEEEHQNVSNETEGRDAIEQGIEDALGIGVIKYTDQRIYVAYLNGSQMLGKFDKIALSGSQRWAFNYISAGETATNMLNVTPALYVLEMTNITHNQIRAKVSTLINQTKS